MPVRALNLKSTQSAREIEAGDGTIGIRMPLTLAGWDVVALVAANGDQPAVVTSADGEYFVGRTQDADEERYVITVELT